MIGIYKITNPKGKIYTGQSTNIEDRYKIGKGLKPIICDTLFGMEFKSLSEASEVLNLNKGNICEVLKGTKIHIKGFVFRYKDFAS